MPRCKHGDVCRAYLRRFSLFRSCILSQSCPSGCEFFEDADKIEPTCNIKIDLRVGHPTTYGVCSRCGALVNAERAVSTATEYLPTRYCPHCGARVVGE